MFHLISQSYNDVRRRVWRSKIIRTTILDKVLYWDCARFGSHALRRGLFKCLLGHAPFTDTLFRGSFLSLFLIIMSIGFIGIRRFYLISLTIWGKVPYWECACSVYRHSVSWLFISLFLIIMCISEGIRRLYLISTIILAEVPYQVCEYIPANNTLHRRLFIGLCR